MLAKIFFNEKEYHRELYGLQALEEAGINSAKLIFKCSGPGWYCVFIEWLGGAENIADRWKVADESEKERLLGRLVDLVFLMYRNSLIQTDPHLENFLTSDDIVYVVDSGAVRVKKSKRTQLKNLSYLLAQIPLADKSIIKKVISKFDHADFLNDITSESLCRHIIEWRSYRLRKYLKKNTRSCTRFNANKSFSEFSVWRRDSEGHDLQELLADPDFFIDQGELLKKGNTATVARVLVGGKELIVKRYNIKSCWHLIGRCWRPTRAWVSWKNAHRLKFYELPTPEPIALIEKRFGPLRGKAYLIMDSVKGNSLADISVENLLDKNIIDQLKAIFLGMFEARLSHGDTKATNWLIHNGKINLIDLDSMKQHNNEKRLLRASRKDFVRFLDNWQGYERHALKDKLHNELLPFV